MFFIFISLVIKYLQLIIQITLYKNEYRDIFATMTKLYPCIYTYMTYYHRISIILKHKKCLLNTNKNAIYKMI